MGFTVHLIRHGQTSSYEDDAGLTELGHRQAAARGRALAAVVAAGERIGLAHAPTERARRTAEVIGQELLVATSESGRAVEIGAGRADPGFANVTVWVDGRPWEPTQVRALQRRLATADDPPGWVTEAGRFWAADATPGGAMSFWLTTPLLWHEPPGSVVQRLLETARRHATSADRPDRLIAASHAGALRALVAWAAGSDHGEPDNAEEVTLVMDDDVVTVAFRGNDWRARFPIRPTAWFPTVPVIR